MTIVATIHILTLWSHFPLPCIHKIQTLIILKISNTIQWPPNSVTLSAGTEMVAWGILSLISSNQPSDTSRWEMKHSSLRGSTTCQAHVCYSPPPFPNSPPRRDIMNLFSQQRALKVGKKKKLSFQLEKHTSSFLQLRWCEHFQHSEASGAGMADQVWVGNPLGGGSQGQEAAPGTSPGAQS